MKKLLILFCVAALSMAACQTKTPMKVGMMGCYALDEDEKEAVVDKKLLKLYDDEIRIAETQSFINKLTVSDKHKKYFGFILADLPDQIIVKLKADSSINIVEEKKIESEETAYYFYKVKKNSGLHLVKILYKQPSLTNSIMVDAVFEDEKLWNAFYQNDDAFIKKFDCPDEKK